MLISLNYFDYIFKFYTDLHLIEPEQCLIGNRKYLCHDHKKCIDVENVCNNNYDDCLDKSDEGGLCNTTGMCLFASSDSFFLLINN